MRTCDTRNVAYLVVECRVDRAGPRPVLRRLSPGARSRRRPRGRAAARRRASSSSSRARAAQCRSRSALSRSVAAARDLAARSRDRRRASSGGRVGAGCARPSPSFSSPSTRFVTLVAVHLQPLAHLAQRQRAAAASREQHQRLVARERQRAAAEQLVEPREQDLLHAHHRRDGAPSTARRPAPQRASTGARPPRSGRSAAATPAEALAQGPTARPAPERPRRDAWRGSAT